MYQPNKKMLPKLFLEKTSILSIYIKGQSSPKIFKSAVEKLNICNKHGLNRSSQ